MRAFTLLLIAGCAFSQTAKFPASVASEADMKVAVNRYQTTLIAPVTAGDTAIGVATTVGAKANMLVTIENEVVSVCAAAGNLLTIGTATACPSVTGRGFDGSSAASHANGRAVAAYIDAWHHNAVVAEVGAVEKWTAPAANIKGFGAVCDGSDQNTAVQAAITAGAKRIFIPAGCMWIAPGGVIPAELTVIGENWKTSIIQSAVDPSLSPLKSSPGTRLVDLNLRGSTCRPPHTPNDCPIHEHINATDQVLNIVSTGYSTFDSVSGITGVDTTGVFFKGTGETAGDAVNISNNCGGACIGANPGNSLRADNYGKAGVASVFGTVMPGSTDGATIFSTSNFAPGKNPNHIALYDTNRVGGTMFQVNHRTSDFVGNFMTVEMADISGSFTGKFVQFTKGGVLKFSVDDSGNVLIGTQRIMTGAGTPEGAVVAPVGSLYLRSDGGAGTTLYIKESGAGGNGWVAK